MKRVGVVIPAGGSGQRMGGQFKPYLALGGEPLLKLALAPFLERRDVVHVVIAMPRGLDDKPDWLTDDRITIVQGGKERIDSVRAGIAALSEACEIVLIHDAARPLVSAELIERVIATAAQGVGALAALPANDTIHEVDGDRIVSTPDRSRLYQAQTPQGFPRAMILAAHGRALSEGAHGTDDADLVVRYGGTVRIVEGDPANVKITRAEDLSAAEALLAARRA
jgi:2-C-methyl-D-erythritol 4-phosphate cytidylyltransferase